MLNRIWIRMLLGVFLGLSGFAPFAFARPEYAVKLGVVNCAACHASPFGGSIRNTSGKSFASRNLGFAPLSKQDKASGDLRAELFEPKNPTTTTNGLVLMTAIIAGNIPLSDETHDTQTRVVAAYNMGALPAAVGIREGYLLHQTAPPQEHSWVKYLTFGRFNVPFGLMTDEHRTFVRVQTKTSENDFEMGGAISAEPSDQLHLDFLLTNGFQNGGQNYFTPAPPAVAGDLTWAAMGNLRWNPGTLPFFVGQSGSYHHTILGQYSPWASSTYAALSLDRLTRNFLSGALLGEFVLARGWNDLTRNPDLGRELLPATDLMAPAVVDSESMGFLLQANYDLSERFTLIYRLEELVLDHRFTADRFLRNGFGLRTFLASNIDLTARYEIGSAGRSTITAANSLGATNDFFALLHLWF